MIHCIRRLFRCAVPLLFQVPIQVRKSLAVADGVRIVGMVRSAVAPGHGGRLLRRQQRVVLTSEDMPDLEDLSLADEFALVRLMEEAAQHASATNSAPEHYRCVSIVSLSPPHSPVRRPDLEDLSLADEFALVRLMEEAAQHEPVQRPLRPLYFSF
ncbi:unnamed protein product [Closterium sp. Naga37s-1]|nr:unnamed protein product [Closterium sp. Naga37s-1]